MKIEAGKNQPVEKKDSKNVFKIESSVFDTSANPLKTGGAASAPASSAFARILAETRQQKDNPATVKTDSAEPDSTASKSDTDEKISRQTDEKKELKERREKQGDGDARQNADEHQSPTLAPVVLQSPTKPAENAVPAARSILHVADLERIVATIRAETFQNQKQVTIALKNSVLQGLQIKLTITENGKLKAEFLALDEQIKKQLSQRKDELSAILKNRSALFSEVEIKSRNESEKE